MPGSARESRGGVCLFNLQRVNNAFYGGITGSSKLMRLMFLALYSNDVLKKAAVIHDDLVPYHTPLFSILEMLESKAGRELLDWDFGSSALAQTDSASGETILTVKLHDMNLQSGSYKRAISRITKAWDRPEASWRRIKISNAKEPVPLTLRLETFSDRRRWTPHIGKVRVTWKFRGDDTLEYAFDLFIELFRLLNDRGDAIRDLHEKWETEMREARSKWNSWISQLKIEGNGLGDPKFSRSYEGKSLALEAVKKSMQIYSN
ncbi:hypothetical protein CBER1_09031 [Cercospora berteroae]|uniref:Uncharacterized protein n=1 Tax=Cercospora berteroae TaxID=357750 RepID=A0A2S6CC71_9PEZI|nr:hypothetical protein CBER1_09031 [Cercospora berteroae]